MLLLILLGGCGERRPDAPPVEYITTGGGRFEWSQEAPSAQDVDGYTYAAYVNDERQPLPQTICAPSRPPTVFSCSAPLPALSPGRHVVELVAVIDIEGRMFESARSAPVLVTVASAAGAADRILERRRELTSNRHRYRVEIVARGLTRPVALAFLPDGRLLIAERDGSVKMLERGSAVPATAFAGQDLHEHGEVIVHDLVLAPDWSRQPFALMLYTVISASNASTRLVRFGLAGSVLGAPEILLPGAASSRLQPTAAMAFGADGTLYVATNDAGAPRLAEDPGTDTGKLLRLNADGSTPSDQPDASPVSAGGMGQPVALGRHPVSGRLWLVDRSASAAGGYDLDRVFSPRATGATLYAGSGLPAFRYSLFVASRDGPKLERLILDPATRLWTRRGMWLPRWLGRIETVREGVSGFLYIGTGNSEPPRRAQRDVVARIVPAGRRTRFTVE